LNRRLDWDPIARAELAALARRDQRTGQRVYAGVRRFAEQNVGDIRKLVDQENIYRLRVGDWRVLFTFEDAGRTVVVLRILNRRDAYR
jgi:mRNA interferase RelE/StbE